LMTSKAPLYLIFFLDKKDIKIYVQSSSQERLQALHTYV
jgi:hypothetical protein